MLRYMVYGVAHAQHSCTTDEPVRTIDSFEGEQVMALADGSKVRDARLPSVSRTSTRR
jgi:hypothetical protein